MNNDFEHVMNFNKNRYNDIEFMKLNEIFKM